jgi:AcrR family transcriptional regulator
MVERRKAILDAAQRLFLTKGFAATTIADIRAASGASVGSIYHAFASKEGIATTLVERSLAGWSRAAAQAADQKGSFDLVIKATVEGLLRWAADDPEAFQILDELRGVSERGEAGAQLAAMIENERAASRKIIAQQRATGAIRDIPDNVAQALVVGPAYEYLRARRGKIAKQQLETVVTLFTEAAWNSLKTQR